MDPSSTPGIVFNFCYLVVESVLVIFPEVKGGIGKNAVKGFRMQGTE
jgi:hypothetical protein